MIKLITPKPFFYEGDERAVLLLHSFTSTTSDMKRLAKFLHKQGYTCYAPLYRGHGNEPEVFLQYTVKDWWDDAEAAFHHLQALGYTKIAVIGLSLGGLFTLKLAEEQDVLGIVTMSVPNEEAAQFLALRFKHYVERTYELLGASTEEIAEKQQYFQQRAEPLLTELVTLIQDVHAKAPQVKMPSRLLYGGEDRPLYKSSAERLAEALQTANKATEMYPHAGHLMTVSQDMQLLQADIEAFLETLDW